MTFGGRDPKLAGLNAAGAAACALVVVTFCLAGVRPLLGRAAGAAAARSRLAAAVQQRDLADAAARDGAEQLRQARRETAATALVLLPPGRVNDVLARVAAVSADCRVRLDDLKVGTLSVGDRYATVPVHAVGRGAYGDCVRFLHRLNRDCPDVGVAALSLAGSGSDAAGMVGIELDLRWHAVLPTAAAH